MTTVFNATDPSLWTVCVPPPTPAPVPAANLSTLTHPLQLNASTDLHFGQWNANHTSALGIFYKPSTLPTPWPVLLTGFAISFLSALFTVLLGTFGDFDEYARPSHFLAVISSTLSAYQIVRAVLAFGTACQALAGVGGRYLPPSSLVALFISLAPYALDANVYAAMRALSGFSALFSVITLMMMLVTQLYVQGHDHYGKWFLAGGTCAKVVGSLDAAHMCYQQMYVGCGVQQLVDAQRANDTIKSGFLEALDPNRTWPRNAIWLSETVLAMVISLPLQFLGFISVGVGLIMYLYFALIWVGKSFARPLELDRDDDMHEFKTKFAMGSLVVILFFASISVPIHYVSQTQSTTYVVQDSIGNLSAAVIALGNETFNEGKPLWQTWTGDGVLPGSWTDFFVVETPVDRWGFLNLWWQTHGARVWYWLSAM